ncbi:Granzyme H [Myotis davidii]|uniref:Granzyme H n=1 Tax=Myotis davidii TaxID=225400 RepID=L5LQB6_MYODS|nr:Granzyme H [Myotis davidii]
MAGHRAAPEEGPWVLSSSLAIWKVGSFAKASGRRSITVILGAHNIRKRERTQQVIPVKTAIRHPNYHPKVNDIMLLQGYDCPGVPGHLLNETSCPLPSAAEEGHPDCCREPPQAAQEGRAGEARMVWRVAGWGRLDLNTSTATLHEAELKIQQDEQCISCYRSHYNRATEI